MGLMSAILVYALVILLLAAAWLLFVHDEDGTSAEVGYIMYFMITALGSIMVGVATSSYVKNAFY
jgi:hypothetical protein